MKRMRDDNYASASPLSSSLGKSYVGGGIGDDGGIINYKKKPTIHDTLSYLKDIKEKFQHQKGIYDKFLEYLRDFRAQRTDISCLVARVDELFKGHNDLIIGFNIFLPKELKITIYEEVDEEEAVKTLLVLPSQFKLPLASSPGKSYVGGYVEINYQKKLTIDDGFSYLKDVKKELFQDQRGKYHKFFELLKDFEAEKIDISCLVARVDELFKGHNNLISGFNTFLPKGLEITLCEEDEDEDEDEDDDKDDEDEDEDEEEARPDESLDFVNKIKKRFPHDEDVYKSFVEIINMYRNHDKRLIEVYLEVSKLIKDHPDLLGEFCKYLHAPRPATLFNRVQAQPVDDPGSGSPPAVPQMLIDNDPQPDSDVASLGGCDHTTTCSDPNVDKPMHIEPREQVEKENGERRSCELDGGEAEEQGNLHHPPKKRKLSTRSESFEAYSDPNASHYEKNDLKESLSIEEHISRPRKGARSKDKYMGKSIQELDLSDCVRCTPSYRLLPSDYPRYKSGALVLNDHWVSVNENYSYKHRHINQYEECLFKCEDDRFELDILLESAGSTAQMGEELLNSIIEKKISLEEGSFVVEDHFTALNLRCIERLYGDHGLEVNDTIRKNPADALPVILSRLKQKQDEGTKCREDLNLVWADVYAKYHYKSLDHRSFSFKQQDSKYLSVKALVSEIKDLKRKCQKESNIPHLEYEYLDGSIHEDLLKLVQFSCEEIYSNKEKMDTVLSLWNSFLELMLGVPPRSKGSEDSVEHHGVSTTSEEASKDVTTRVFYGNDDFYMFYSGFTEFVKREFRVQKHIAQVLVHYILMQGKFMSALFSLLNGSVENYEFEDECRAIIGNQSYVLFTLDKLLYRLVKQLQAVVADDMDNKLLRLYESEKPGRVIDTVYYENARNLLHEENIYRLECSSSSSPPRLSIQLMDGIQKKPGAYAVSMDPLFASRYPPQTKFLSISSLVPPQAIMLRRPRSKRKEG